MCLFQPQLKHGHGVETWARLGSIIAFKLRTFSGHLTSLSELLYSHLGSRSNYFMNSGIIPSSHDIAKVKETAVPEQGCSEWDPRGRSEHRLFWNLPGSSPFLTDPGHMHQDVPFLTTSSPGFYPQILGCCCLGLCILFPDYTVP